MPTVTSAISQLCAEGYTETNVRTAIDSLINAGLEVVTDGDVYLTANEMDILRGQLDSDAVE